MGVGIDEFALLDLRILSSLINIISEIFNEKLLGSLKNGDLCCWARFLERSLARREEFSEVDCRVILEGRENKVAMLILSFCLHAMMMMLMLLHLLMLSLLLMLLLLLLLLLLMRLLMLLLLLMMLILKNMIEIITLCWQEIKLS